MKKCSLFFATLLLGALPVVAHAASLAEGVYKCKSEDLDNNLKTAKYIVVAKLEKYLDDGWGEYRVVMNLRGPIEVGTRLNQRAPKPLPLNEDGSQTSSGSEVKLGQRFIYMGERVNEIEDYTRLKHYECKGIATAERVGENRDTLNFVIDRILGQEQ